MARYFLELAYRGTRYNGWQIQSNAPSVQQTLQQALSTLLRTDITVTGAGRTDTGVHARFYVVHFDHPDPGLEARQQLVYHLNAILPEDIAAGRLYRVRDDAHARFSALRRKYQYHIATQKDPFLQDTVWRYTVPLDVEKMNTAAAELLGKQDFSSFEKLHSDNKTSICTVIQARWHREGRQLVFVIEADRFLRNMVRAIVGTLVDVGRGKVTVEQFRVIVKEKSRCGAGGSAPAQGLFLTDVKYPDDIAMIPSDLEM